MGDFERWATYKKIPPRIGGLGGRETLKIGGKWETLSNIPEFLKLIGLLLSTCSEL